MEQLNKLYIGNLSYNTTEDGIRSLFQQNGIEPKSVALIKDRDTGNSKGFGFVEVESKEAVQKAIEAMNGKDLDGRSLKVNEAKPREERTGGSGFGGGGSSRY